MSVAAIAGRVAELQALLQQATGVVAPPATAGPGAATAAGSFAAELANAQATAPGAGVTAASGSGSGADGGPYAAMIREAATRHGIDPQVFTNLVRQESGFDPRAGSAAGAQGLCQLMPATAASLGVRDPLDPAQSLDGGARYLRQQLDRFGGDYVKALAAYNAGPGAVARYGGVPPYAETQHYVQAILGRGGSPA
ncbi:lytic transglycosylase domain-containing protein [Patulibacter defluvii]|uniref:lytic transglycosylase domain-containing protein n=1 Tax=Patulibacter defluvii TaxID=3095358 RepID=UPI002A75C772|nr:lytic transglycosylase domain-containing protein [Patulibacter sp. DM4]